MTDNKYDRRVRNKDTGKLDMTRLYKAPTGTTKVFTKKQERKGKRYNIAICVDCSGSMSDRFGNDYSSPQKREIAAYCATMLDKHFHNIGLNTCIIGYGSLVHVVKKMGSLRVNLTKIEERLLYCDGGGTSTHNGLAECYKQLRSLDGEKIVLVLTDGLPDSRDLVRKIVKRHPKILTLGIGIGIEASNVTRGVIVNTKEQLFEQFTGLMSEYIKRQ
jgi:uncharacterized protein with von Willebrand factor type A (vWA) domain